MSLTPSTMLPLGTIAPDFTLMDSKTKTMVSLSEVKSNIATVIMFICNHCPYVIHVQQELVKLANDYQPQDISFIAISSNDVATHPDDSPENMRQVAKELGYPFPYLYDETQAIAKAYQAACTPDLYIFDQDSKCVYRGRLDDSSPGNDLPVTGNYIRTALDNILAGKPIDHEQKPSMGCNIKWK